MKVRRAKVDDLVWCVEQGIDFLKTRWPDKPIDKSILYLKLYSMIHSHILLISEEKDGTRTGMIGALIVESMWYTAEFDLVELFWWVPEEYRNSRAGLILLNEFTNIGKELGAKHLVLSLLTISPIDDNALIKRGFHLEEKAFIMEV